MRQLSYGSVFSGIGGIDRGFDLAGWQCAFQIENDKWATKVLEHRWPDTQRYGDVKTVDANRIEQDHVGSIDALVGGFPCTDISLAGKRAGLAGERSGLFFEFMRLADELAPRWLLIENVPGLLSSGKRRDMGAVIGAMGDLGYGFAWRVLDAQYFGLAQRRKRLFLVGHLGTPWSAPAEVLLEPESSERDSPPSRPARPGSPHGAPPSTRSDGSSARRHRPDGVVAALRSNYGGVGADDNQAQAGHLVSYDVPDVAGTLGGGAQLRGWSDDLDRSGAFPVVKTAYAVADTLTGGNNPNSNVAGRRKEDDKNLVLVTHDVSPCLQERGYKGVDSDATQALVFVPASDEDYAQAFIENQQAEIRMSDVAMALAAKGGKPGQGYAAIFDPRGRWAVHNGDSVAVAENAALTITGSKGNPGNVNDFGMVRRLTVLECERLQGFDDGWTDVGLSDSRRYKALGNAVAVPVAEWLGRRIRDVELAA